MDINVLFPCDFFDKKQVENDYKEECLQATKCGFSVILYDYDTFVQEGILRIYADVLREGLCLYRGWMLPLRQYKTLYASLLGKGVTLINSPSEYENCHLFPKAYPQLVALTPQILVYETTREIDWDVVKQKYPRFMVKDFVKSVKGSGFPPFFDASYSNDQLDRFMEEFKELRGDLFTGGIVIKAFVDLAIENATTNEYRGFYLYNQLLTLSRNTNQPETAPCVPEDILAKVPKLESNFYTVDFAELANGQWIVIETGDGQVSGLSPAQDIAQYYQQLSRFLAEKP